MISVCDKGSGCTTESCIKIHGDINKEQEENFIRKANKKITTESSVLQSTDKDFVPIEKFGFTPRFHFLHLNKCKFDNECPYRHLEPNSMRPLSSIQKTAVIRAKKQTRSS